MRLILALVATVLSAPASAQDLPALEAGATVAFFGVHLIDTSLEGEVNGPRADEAARVALLEEEVHQRLRDEGFALADLGPVADELERTLNPARCNGCALRMAERLGADYALTGEVQKVSNLILSVTLALTEVEGGRLVRALAVDIRGNTDEAWLRGGRYILDNHVFRN